MHLDLASCSIHESWMSLQDVDASRAHWITLDHLEEIVFPPNSLIERLRRLLIAPRLRRVSIFGGNFLPSSPNQLAIIVGDTHPSHIPIYRVFTLWLLVPEVESLTLVCADGFGALHGWSEYLVALEGLVGRFAEQFKNYPLPCAAASRTAEGEEWIVRPQIMLPRLRTLKLRRVTPNLPLRLLPLRQGASWDGRRADPLHKVEISGQQEPKDWHRVAEILRTQGIVVESEFGAGKDLPDTNYGLSPGSI
ncbi:hypothetical protein CALVIDRAFT_540547 [Calocera viscosa TUFC12733]|uniref:Uncharacterized protein n=1 Tax=Calocera viscosa (strain TUFC12733) TaxID=1330018 RepID=A0A167IR32_CALVF|nr:hypothetical protein CALVIDRAFT_540547 [Calocera viscosa TUFC12733]